MIIDRIHEFNRFGMVLGLDRMEELLRRLGNPQDDLKVIHVAGTNGKGSVSKYLEEGLSACGYKMGLYTSPYIETFNERIRYDGADISDEDLEYYGQKVVSAAEAMVADFGVAAEAVPDVEAAVYRAKELADCYDVILFAGSLYLIGDVRRLWRNERGEER